MRVRYRVDLTPAARKQLKQLPKAAQSRIALTLEVLAETPRPPKSLKLTSRDDYWRVRTGDYQIIYQIEDERLVVLAVKIGHRRDVYR